MNEIIETKFFFGQSEATQGPMESSSPSSSITPSASSLHMAACLNNKGAQLLGAGDFSAARNLFRKALGSLTASARASLEATNTCYDETSSHRVFSSDSVTLFPHRELQQAATSTDASSLYSRAIPVPLPNNLNSCCDEVSHQTLSSACCTFNLALIYHIRGLQAGNGKQDGGNQQQRLLKAQSLYSKCSRLVFAQGLGCCVGKHPVLDLLSMAVLNNRAHVYYELSNYQSARDCIDCLLYVASTVSPCIYKNQNVEGVIHEAKQTFCLNAFVLRPPPAAHAA